MRVGKTYLQIVNLVLGRLREDTVANFTSPTAYTTFIMNLVNVVKSEIEDAYPWQSLRDTFTFTTTPGTPTYTFTGAGSTPWIIDAYNNTTGGALKLVTEEMINRAYFSDYPSASGAPAGYIPNGIDASYDLKIDLWPNPDAAYVLYFNLYVPQVDLSATTDVCLIPPAPLVEGVLARALMERGDDGGDGAQAQFAMYQKTLSDAVAIEASRQANQLVWRIV